MKAQRVATHQGVILEIGHAPRAGERQVQRERDEGQQQVDDPDAEILAARAGELDVQLPGFVPCAGCAAHPLGWREIVVCLHG
ncbi:hypothetical protein FQZ97_1196000 [compost metagenome]